MLSAATACEIADAMTCLSEEPVPLYALAAPRGISTPDSRQSARIRVAPWPSFGIMFSGARGAAHDPNLPIAHSSHPDFASPTLRSPGSYEMEDPRPQSSGPSDRRSRHREYAGRLPGALRRTPSSFLTARISRTGSTKTASLRSGRSRMATWKSSPATGYNLHARFLRRLPAARGIRRAVTGQGREPGARQQRRLSDGPLRDSGARLVREQNLRRRTGFRGLRTISAAGECVAASGDSGRPTTSSSTGRTSRMARSLNPRA